MPIPILLGALWAAATGGVAGYGVGKFAGSFLEKRTGGNNFSVNNKTGNKLFVALHLIEDGKWVTKKWYTVEPYSERMIIDRGWQYQESTLYYHICTENDKKVWEDRTSYSEYFDNRTRYFYRTDLGFFNEDRGRYNHETVHIG